MFERRQVALGRLDDAAYAALLPRWRDAVRRFFVASLHREMHILEAIQVRPSHIRRFVLGSAELRPC